MRIPSPSTVPDVAPSDYYYSVRWNIVWLISSSTHMKLSQHGLIRGEPQKLNTPPLMILELCQQDAKLLSLAMGSTLNDSYSIIFHNKVTSSSKNRENLVARLITCSNVLGNNLEFIFSEILSSDFLCKRSKMLIMHSRII